MLLPVPAHAIEPPASPMQRIARGASVGFDVLLMRPVSAVATCVGAVLFVPVAALTAANGRESVEEAFELFVSTPAYNVYGRPLGEF